MTKDEALKMAIKKWENNFELARHQTHQETMYWFNQYKMAYRELLIACKEALASNSKALEQPAQDVTDINVVEIPKIIEWQGLTDEEIYDIIDNVFSKSAIEKNGVKTCSVHEGFRAIEQALKEKNT